MLISLHKQATTTPKIRACLIFFSGFHVKREPLPGTTYMPVSGGGWIVLGLVFKDRFVV
jgi:hypothetical protein